MGQTPRHAFSRLTRDCGLPAHLWHLLSARLLVCMTATVCACLLGLSWFAGESFSAPRKKTSVDAELVKDLTSHLTDSRSAIRREAIVRLAQLGPDASDALAGLKNCLEDTDPFVRAHAARAVYRISLATETAVPVLIELLQPDYPQLCCLVSLVLGEIGPGAHLAVPTLQTCLKASDSSVRLHAAEACLHIDPYDVPALRELLAAMDDDQTDVRYFAANALGAAALDNPQAEFALRWALTDTNANVAITASLNLSKRFDQAVSAAVVEPILSPEEIAQLVEKLKDPSAKVRQTAAIKLGMAGRSARVASSALRESLADDDLAVRLHVTHTLWHLEHQAGEVVPELIDMLGVTRPNVSIGAISMLGEIGPLAEEALPSLNDMFAGAKLRERLHLACMISRIDPRNREMIGIVVSGLTETAGDVRYLAALALGCSPVGHQRRVERVLAAAADDRNLRVQSAATEANHRLHARVTQSRNALSAQYASNFGKFDEAAPQETPTVGEPTTPGAASPDAIPEPSEGSLRLNRPAARRGEPSAGPSIADIARSVGPTNSAAVDEDVDPEEGLKPISVVRASIQTATGPLPPDYAAAKMAAQGPGPYHGLGYQRGFTPMGFGWDAPAVCYKPLFFEDINVERYGIHYGFFETVISTGRFSKNTILLPYHILIQPMCEQIYTLGYERPSNCVPLHCFHTALPDWSIRSMIQRCTYRPYRAACPWESEDGVCYDDCDADCSDD